MTIADVFRDHFGGTPTVVADAPGRVNIIGEHTDYNDGFVLPTAIPQRTRVAMAPRDDDHVRAVTDAPAIPLADARADYRLGEEHRAGTWDDFLEGCTAMLRAEGYTVRGFDAVVRSTVPVGSGLSSSAALEVAILRALRRAFALQLDDVQLALIAHRAETELVGARVGIMDQMASSLADEHSALFLDTRSRAWERVPLPASCELAVIDSGITHRHVGGEYNLRRGECERAAALLGVSSLRDLGEDGLARAATLPSPLDRRVRHVLQENARVLAAVAALRAGDVAKVGTLLVEGHASLRDDYEVSVPPVDRLVELATADPDVLGARMTGGGFGGAIVALVRAGRAAAAAARISEAYGREYRGGRVLVPAARRDDAGGDG